MRTSFPKNDAIKPTFVRCPGGGRGRRHQDQRRRTVARIERSEIRGTMVRFSPSLPGFASLNPGYKIFQTRFRQSKEAERRQTRRQKLHLPAQRCPHPDPPPHAGEGMGGGSSPVGVPLRLLPGRQLVPKAQRQAMLRGSSPERSVLYGRLNREAETLRFSTGVTRAGKTNEPVPVQRAPRAPVMMPAG